MPNVLPVQEVHLYLISLDGAVAQIPALWSVLAADEQQRAERFRFERDRQRYIAARGYLRHLLGRYLDQPPASLTFQYSQFGKPALTGATSLQFNLSHAQGMALYGLVHHAPIGVDLEQIRPKTNALELAQRFFAPPEVRWLETLTPAQRDRAFFRLWTCKEAYLKATGEGLVGGLETVEIQLSLTESACLHRLREDAQANHQWFLQELIPHPNYAAAVVVAGQNWQLQVFCRDEHWGISTY